MNRSSQGDRAILAAVARQAMIERGLEPDFSPTVQQELATINGPADATSNLRDLRNCLWASIDKAEQIGLNWWRNDPRLTMAGATAAVVAPELDARLTRIEEQLTRLAQSAGPASGSVSKSSRK